MTGSTASDANRASSTQLATCSHITTVQPGMQQAVPVYVAVLTGLGCLQDSTKPLLTTPVATYKVGRPAGQCGAWGTGCDTLQGAACIPQVVYCPCYYQCYHQCYHQCYYQCYYQTCQQDASAYICSSADRAGLHTELHRTTPDSGEGTPRELLQL